MKPVPKIQKAYSYDRSDPYTSIVTEYTIEDDIKIDEKIIFEDTPSIVMAKFIKLLAGER